jgi:hypothetical protein
VSVYALFGQAVTLRTDGLAPDTPFWVKARGNKGPIEPASGRRQDLQGARQLDRRTDEVSTPEVASGSYLADLPEPVRRD